MTPQEREQKAYEIAGYALFNVDNDHVFESLDIDTPYSDYEAIYANIRGIGEELLARAGIIYYE
jgi:hypothetical protein